MEVNDALPPNLPSARAWNTVQYASRSTVNGGIDTLRLNIKVA